MSISKARPIRGEVRDGTKTGRNRIVPIPPSLLPWLRSYIDSIPGSRFDRSLPLFTMNWFHVENSFKRICRRCKIEGHRAYDLRHSFVSLLLSNGAPVSYIADAAGHSNPSTTLRHYAAWVPSQSGQAYFVDDCLKSEGKVKVSEQLAR